MRHVSLRTFFADKSADIFGTNLGTLRRPETGSVGHASLNFLTTPTVDTGLPVVTPSLLAEGVMHGQQRITITDAEVLAVSGGVDDASDQPVVVLTLRPITGSGWGHVSYSLHPDNARSLIDRLSREFDTSPYLKPDQPGTTA